MRFFTLVLLAPLLLASSAAAEAWDWMKPGVPYEVEWTLGDKLVVEDYPRVPREARVPESRWFQVAPGGKAAAVSGPSSGFQVFSATGTLLYRRKKAVSAFCFSRAGDRLALISGKKIEVLSLEPKASPEPRVLAEVAGADWLRFSEAGLVVRSRRTIVVIDDGGTTRVLAKATSPRITAIAVGGTRVAYFTKGVLTTLDLLRPEVRDVVALSDKNPVLDAELSPDGRDLVWSTARRVYERAGDSTPKLIAETEGIHSLFFSPNGSAWLWASRDGGALVTGGTTQPLPQWVASARFPQDRDGLVLTGRDGVELWDPATGKKIPVGGYVVGYSFVYAINLSGDVVGADGAIVLIARLPHDLKIHSAPESPARMRSRAQVRRH